MKRRRKGPGEMFGLSFLDCICCGFGAVILLFVMTTREDGAIVAEITADFEAEVMKAEQVLAKGRENLVELRNRKEKLEQEVVEARGLAVAVNERIRETEREMADKKRVSTAQIDRLKQIEEDLKVVQEEVGRLTPGATANAGQAIRPSAGTERRHYLTGLKVDGKRALILVDASLSMLDYTMEDVIQHYYGTTPAEKLKSAKWIRVLDSVDWLMATMEADEYQLVMYNDRARFVLPGSEGQWLQKKDWQQVQALAHCVWNTAPEGGSNLEQALKLAATLSPAADNIYILTDGLPNQSDATPSSNRVTPRERQRHFHAALGQLPRNSPPIHTILYPFSGDTRAAMAYWLLAERTKGSCFSPTWDWPN